MYKALVEKDASYEGTFVAAVKTTGVFCRPTCTARKPKKENVEFFKTAREALRHGYRPCKVCFPLEMSGATPNNIRCILKEININPSIKFKDHDLRSKGMDPNTIRRWFKKNHGMTFQAFQRMLRINTAFKKIQKGETITMTAFESGYNSLSGFNDSFKSIFGVSPSDGKNKQIIDVTRIETPLGTMLAGAVKDGICLLEFTDRTMLETELKHLSQLLNAYIIQGTNPHFATLEQQLNEYFEGKRKEFSIPLVTPGTKFQQMVWRELQAIPYGSTRTYRQQAAALKKPEAVRAVARANGMNRIAIIIPCHRVIGSDGHLTGYGGGLAKKKWLLELENNTKKFEI